MDKVPLPDPYVSAIARQLAVTMLQRAWIEDGTLFIQTPFETIEVGPAPDTNTAPADAPDRVETTLPRGPRHPAQTLAGGSDPPQDPEPPSEPDTTGSGLDDFTAIPGIGPVTAGKLHDAGLYTYDDLREWGPELYESHITKRQWGLIQEWLEERLL